MSKRKKKLYIDIETVSTDFGKPGQTMIAAYRVGNGPIEIIELDPSRPGRDIHSFTEEFFKQGYGIRESIRKAFKKAKANNFSKAAPTSLDNRWLTCPSTNAMSEAELNEKYKDQNETL